MVPVCFSAAVSLASHLVRMANFLARAIKQASAIEPRPFTAKMVLPVLSTVMFIITFLQMQTI